MPQTTWHSRQYGNRLVIFSSTQCVISLWRDSVTLWIHRLPTQSPEVDGITFSFCNYSQIINNAPGISYVKVSVSGYNRSLHYIIIPHGVTSTHHSLTIILLVLLVPMILMVPLVLIIPLVLMVLLVLMVSWLEP